MIQWGPILVPVAMFIYEKVKNFKYKKSIGKLIEANEDGKITQEEYDVIAATIKEETFGKNGDV